MENNTSILFSFFGLIIFCLIMWAVIGSATKSSERNKILLQNQKLLALIAEKLGCDVSMINDVMRGKK